MTDFRDNTIVEMIKDIMREDSNSEIPTFDIYMKLYEQVVEDFKKFLSENIYVGDQEVAIEYCKSCYYEDDPDFSDFNDNDILDHFIAEDRIVCVGDWHYFKED